MSGYGNYGYGYGGGAYTTQPGAYGYQHGLTQPGESYYSSHFYGDSHTVNSGYETYAGGRSYYAATFSQNGDFVEYSYSSSAGIGSYESRTTYVSHTTPPSYGFSYYSYAPFQSEQIAQTSTYEQQGSMGYLHITDGLSESYFNGGYHTSYSSSDRAMYNGSYVSGSSYKISSYANGYGYTSYMVYHS